MFEINELNLTIIIFSCCFYGITELWLMQKYNNGELKGENEWKRFMLHTYGCIGLEGTLIALDRIYDYYFLPSIIVGFVLFTYTVITEIYFYDKRSVKISINKKNKRELLKLVAIFLALILLIGFSVISQLGFIGGQFVSAMDWFTSIIYDFTNSEDNMYISGFMLMGSITLIIAKGRRSTELAVAGYFLVAALPTFTAFDLFLNGLEKIEYLSPDLYLTFQGNSGLALLVYVTVTVLLYWLLIGLTTSFVDMVDIEF